MSIRALNRLLGRSTIDPCVIEAFEQDRLDEILAEYDFAPDMRRELKAIRASTFEEFGALALDLVQNAEQDTSPAGMHDPRQGLCPEPVVGDEEQAA